MKWYKNSKFIILPFFKKNKLLWKDKFETPRCELIPQYRLEWLWFGLNCSWGNEDYWEQWLWIHEYNNGDEEKAKSTWPWIDYETKQNTWINY
jgi:hypothetical protein